MRIRELREAKRWTQQKLARKVRVSQAYISQIENESRTNIGVDVVVRLAKALEVGLAELIEG